MERVRWLRGVVPVATLALLGSGVFARPPVLAAADPPWVPPPCADAPPGGWAGTANGSSAQVASTRLVGVLDGAGTLAAWRLTLGMEGAASYRMELPPESSASAPVGAVVMVAADDGTRSRVSLVDVARGCATALPDEAEVVRSAVLAPDGRSVVEHRVARVTRADLGIWRVSLDGGPDRRILGAPAADARYGRTFVTELRWLADGRLGATSCGERLCRTRVLDPSTGTAAMVGPTGPVVGFAADGAVIAHEACGGFPCALVRHDPDGRARTLAEAAGPATMAGDVVVFETGAGRRAAVDPATGSREVAP
ncbi:MAG TPA: hypothetical protein VFY23_02060 [Candidatus Limnocylindrales bacterium]|nr:hypothetical protein [Candidatus Limnocylindrales bacterium]